SGMVTYALARPVAAPFEHARSAGELFIALAQELGLKLGVTDIPELLYKHAYALGAPFRSMMDEGTVFTHSETLPSSVLLFNGEAISKAAEAPCAEGELQVAPVVVLGMGTAQTGIPPFATKIVTDYQLSGKMSVAQMNSATAAKLKVKAGDRINLASGDRKITVVVAVFEGILPDTVSLAAGLGHTAFDQFSRGKGSNVLTLTAVRKEPGTGLPVWGLAGVKATRV
ncbi:MAG: molybdopterin dinucleotide binding domain-containing protein, partial [Mailhella sp.]